MKREDRARLGGLETNWKNVFYRKLTRATIPKILSVSPLTNKEQVIRNDVSYIATNIFKNIRYFLS